MAAEQSREALVQVDCFGYLSTGNVMINNRLKRLINEKAEERFRNEVNAWAAANTGRLRTRLAIRIELSRELETLFAALGPWAFVEASELFPTVERLLGEWGE